MAKPLALGEQELEVLRFAADRAPISVGEVAREFGARRGLARTTVLTVMERLRAKGYLTRRRANGVYRYSPRLNQSDVMSGVIADFVERSLGGSLSPFVAYLADTGRLGADEIAQLRRMIGMLEEQEGDAP